MPSHRIGWVLFSPFTFRQAQTPLNLLSNKPTTTLPPVVALVPNDRWRRYTWIAALEDKRALNVYCARLCQEAVGMPQVLSGCLPS